MNYEEYDRQAEIEFQAKCEEYERYRPKIRTTLDGEWEESELLDDIYDVCTEVMTDKLIGKYEFKALNDSNLLKPAYMSEEISNSIDDVIELYNTEYDRHRNDTRFGIVWFDEAIKKMILKRLKENVIT